jgi:hypothetical protein
LPHLIYRQSSKLWECGNREAISKGGGKGGKPDFGFPGFPRTVISTAWPMSLQLGSFLLFFRGSAEAIGFCARLQDVGSIGDSIQQRFAESRIRDDLRPLGKRQVRSQNHCGFLGSLSHDLKQKLGTDLGQWHVSDFVDGNQIVALEWNSRALSR